MNREDILRMAEEAGITNELIVSGWGEHWIDIPVQLERFAALVAAAEREVCAQFCQQAVEESEKTNAELSTTEILEKAVIAGAIHQAHRIDAAIRARGQG